MGVPIAAEFDVGVTKPIDSRMVWSGNANNLNNIPNEFPGLISYVTGDKNLYVFQGNNVWEKIVTTNVDAPSQFNTNFNITQEYNGQVLYANNINQITGTLVPPFPIGFNVTIVQMNIGTVFLTTSNPIEASLRNRIGANITAGQYAIVSILRQSETNNFLLYGDLIN